MSLALMVGAILSGLLLIGAGIYFIRTPDVKARTLLWVAAAVAILMTVAFAISNATT